MDNHNIHVLLHTATLREDFHAVRGQARQLARTIALPQLGATITIYTYKAMSYRIDV
jgi:hypothetical protein